MAQQLSDQEMEEIKRKGWDEIREADRNRALDKKYPPKWHEPFTIPARLALLVVAAVVVVGGLLFWLLGGL